MYTCPLFSIKTSKKTRPVKDSSYKEYKIISRKSSRLNSSLFNNIYNVEGMTL